MAGLGVVQAVFLEEEGTEWRPEGGAGSGRGTGKSIFQEALPQASFNPAPLSRNRPISSPAPAVAN